jgi:plasminogen activator inhibitor 1 RNA-binding protein
MSIVSRNPFDLLGGEYPRPTVWINAKAIDDGEPSPAPAPKAAAQPKAHAAPAPQRSVPGSAPRGGNANRGRGGARGGRPQGEQRNAGPTGGDVQEGFEHPAGFDGERVRTCPT